MEMIYHCWVCYKSTEEQREKHRVNPQETLCRAESVKCSYNICFNAWYVQS